MGQENLKDRADQLVREAMEKLGVDVEVIEKELSKETSPTPGTVPSENQPPDLPENLLSPEEFRKIQEEQKVNALKVLEQSPLKKQNLKKAIRDLAKGTDYLMFYADSESKKINMFYLARLIPYHPQGVGILTEKQDEVPQFAIVLESQIKAMATTLDKEGFTGYFMDKEKSLLWVRSYNRFDIATGNLVPFGKIIVPSVKDIKL